LKCRVELDIAMSGGTAKGQREKELLRDALKHESRIVRKPKAGVERRVTNQHTPICSCLANFGKAPLHKRPPDTAVLPLGFDRNWAKAIPASGTITDGYWRERNMPYDAAGVFSDEGN